MIKRFLSFVEITTKITSIFPFLMVLAYLFYKNKPINWNLTVIFFVSMLVFDLAVTAINNYVDTKTNQQVLQFKRKNALMAIMVLLAIATAFGLYLAYLTDIVVLFLGGLCFIYGVFYTYGPVPISRQPYGEVLSGLFYGYFIPLILLYINMPKGTYLTLDISLKTINLSINIMPFITIGLLGFAPFCTTANIMLANNICDLENDIAVKRYTLPFYLENKSIQLFAAVYYFTYPVVIIMIALKILAPLCLLYLFTLIPVQRNIRVFSKKQEKGETFIVSVKNYVIIMGALTILIFVSGLR